jgi:hypothetical protein
METEKAMQRPSDGCSDCGRTDKALFRTNEKGVPGIFKCRPCIDGQPRISLGQDRELLDAIEATR